MRQVTWIRGRRGAVAGASAAVVVCLGGVLAMSAGSGSDDDGYVAVGAAGGSPPASGATPTGEVSLVPLEGATGGEEDRGSDGAPDGGGSGGAREPGAEPLPGPSASAGQGAPEGEGGSGRAEGRGEGRTEENPAPSSSAGDGGSDNGGGTAPNAPAALKVSEPERKPTDQRWCEKVTLDFHNTGGNAVRSGTVTFETHIIDSLGIDWATIKSAEKLPVPVNAGARKEKTWTVCVDAWRVPLGMHIETQDVSVRWE
ncbi:hypothetical protein [Streptomyces sp. NBC_00286]|uniref:hypothetical protein n=1 Tax=Streptomyces sp. NBC_00286 TaxID=2975701 RepID=UPI002E2A17BB|nr:hypothetical protein [Streptomyces sp. NBC_00286]